MPTFDDAFAAIQRGDSGELLEMLEAEPALAESRSGEGASLVMLAIYYGQAELARAIAACKTLDASEAACLGDSQLLRAILADDPAAANSFSPDGFPIVGFAAYFGHEECVRVLLEAGADPNAVSTNALGVAAIHGALSNGHVSIVRLLAESGADVNAQSAEGWTPLHYCAEIGDAELATYFLERGADPERRRSDGMTPSEAAEAVGHGHVAQAIADFRA